MIAERARGESQWNQLKQLAIRQHQNLEDEERVTTL